MFPVTSEVPPPNRKGGRPLRYPFDRMSAGDSFFVPLRASESRTRAKDRLRAAGNGWAKRHGKPLRFTALDATTVDDKGREIQGVRVWARALDNSADLD